MLLNYGIKMTWKLPIILTLIVWSSAEDYLVLTANHVITLEEYEMNDEVEIVAVATTFPLPCFEAIHPVISRSFGFLTMMIRVR